MGHVVTLAKHCFVSDFQFAAICGTNFPEGQKVRSVLPGVDRFNLTRSPNYLGIAAVTALTGMNCRNGPAIMLWA